MMCSVVFEGTEGNLLRLFEKNRSIVQSTKELSEDAPSKERYYHRTVKAYHKVMWFQKYTTFKYMLYIYM